MLTKEEKKIKNRIASGKYYQKNKEKKIAKTKEWVRNNLKRVNENNKEYRKKHPDKAKQWQENSKITARTRRKENPEKYQEYLRKWKRDNLDKVKKYRDENKEKSKKQRVERDKKFPEKRRTYQRKHRKDNSEKFRSIDREKRARKRHADCERFLVREIYERDNWICQLCKKKVNKKLKNPNPLSASLDHIVPLSKGGAHIKLNVHLAHLICNIRAGTGGIKQTLLF